MEDMNQNFQNQMVGGGERNSQLPRPNNYLAWSIVVTLLCCWPFGIPAIVNSAKVNGLYDRGEYNQAQEASNKAKKWIKWTVIAAAIFWVLYIVLAIEGIVGAGMLSELGN